MKNGIAAKTIKNIVILLTFLSFLKAIWISLDIDEAYAASMGYRLAMGDRLVRDMWEPHQFSAFAAAFFTALYVRVRGSAGYLVIYLRIVGILIHAGFGLILYKRLSKTLDQASAFGLAALHLNFLPKWVQMPEFELMHYWCLLGLFLVFQAYFTDGRDRRLLPFLGGGILTGSMLCYPTMILLYPFYIAGIYVSERLYHGLRGRKAWRGCAGFTLGAFLSGAGVLLYLFRDMSWETFRRSVSYIFSDTSHGVYSMGEKWAMYWGQWCKQGRAYMAYLLIAVGIVLLFSGACRMICREKEFSVSGIGPVVVMALLAAGLLMQIGAIYACLFLDQNQFFFQVRYLAISLPAVVLGIRYHRRMAVWLYFCVLPGLASIPAVLFVTNMDTNVAYTKAFLAVMGSFLIFRRYIRESVGHPFWKKGLSLTHSILGGMVLAGLLVCRLLLIRVTGCLPVTILAPLGKMEDGPEAGIYVLAERARVWNDNYRQLRQYVGAGDKLLYIGAESLVYAGMGAVLSTPSTQGTVVFDGMFLSYYQEHPERIPDVIVFDKTFAEDPVYSMFYGYSLQSGALFGWIAENYGDSRIVETDSMVLIMKNR